MQDDSVLITESWRERLQPVTPAYSVTVVRLTPESRAALRRVGDGDLGEFAVATAGIAFLLRKYFGQADVILRTPCLAENSGMPSSASIALVIPVQSEELIEDYLARVAGIVEDSYAEPEFGARPAVFALRDERIHAALPEQEDDRLRFDLRLDRGEIEIHHSPAVETFLVEGLSQRLSTILAEFERFGEAVMDIDALSTEGRRRLREFNQTGVPRADFSTVVSLFEAEAARTPGAPALLIEDSIVTYAELNAKANTLACQLRDVHAIGPESLVGIMLDRSEHTIVAILGVLKAGAAFVPIDSSYPLDRVNYILADTGLPLLITQSELLVHWLEFSGQVLAIDLELPGWKIEPANPAPAASPQNLAYVIYTSGSTGQPKGVLLNHGNLFNYVEWACGYYFPDGVTGNFGLYSSLSFDFTLTNIFCPLARGKSLRIYGQALSIETILTHAFQVGSGVDTLKLTPSHIRLLEYMDLPAPGIRKVIAGGEELTARHIAILDNIDPAIEIYNEYGPTEATVGCIVSRVEAHADTVPIGRPIANTRVYILDEDGKPVPLGVRGEICIAGDGLARGYLNRPDVTAARFITEPFAGEPRLYRTGDIGRWLPDGQIQCFGRLDDQVKIRGYRVELGEIEAALVEHEEVSAASVVPREDAHGARKLIAFVKGSANLTAPVLRTWLAGKLPDYMVPADIHFVAGFPLNANGKVDRAALTAPSIPASLRQIDATPIQHELLRIWREIFDAPAIGLADGFFDLGGDSLLAVQIVSRVWSAFSVEVSIDDIFKLQTIEVISGLIEAATPLPPEPAIRPSARTHDLPLSFAQQRLWFLGQLEGPSAAYNLSSAVRIEGALDAARIEFALSEVCRRHEILRTTFPSINGRPSQHIAPHTPVALQILAVRTEADAISRATEDAARPFDLAAGPLYRAVLYRVHSRLHILGIAMHHMISDAWSSGIFIGEISALYESRPLPELAIQYADYAAWQREQLESTVAREHLALHKAALAGAPDLLELPTDRPRPAVQTFRGSSVPFDLDSDLTGSLRSLAQNSGGTPFMVFLAAYALLLSRYSGQKDVVIGSPVANRSVPEVEGLIGFFVNTLALRVDTSSNPSFRELLARAARVALDNYARQEIPFEQIVDSLQLERNLSRSPIFQTMLAYENASTDILSFPDLAITPVPVESRTAKFDLTLYIEDSRSTIAGAFEYNADLFDAVTIDRMAGHFRTLLGCIAADPDTPIDALPLLSSEERRQVTVEWNQTEADYADTPVHKLFELQAARTPDNVAAVFESSALTYRELNLRANRLAGELMAEGVGPDMLVGVSMERSLEMIVALLAILKAGGAYVPIDPDYPAERVRFMLENSQVAWLLTQAHLVPSLPETEARIMAVEPEAPDPAFAQNPEPAITPANLAYMIYTSGSTGRPKGALNTHRALTNRILWMQDAYRLTPQDAVLQKTPFSFDVSVWEFFWPLVTGARLVFARPGGQRESDYLADLIVRARITTLHFVPSMLRAFLEEPDVERCTTLRRVICSGEALPLDLQQKFFERLSTELHNLYGPTEAAVDVTFWQCSPNDSRRSVPIGRPIANTRIYIVDEFLQPSPIGIPGELLIGGVAVGRGYYREPELTRAKFIPDPFDGAPEARLYRTGDLARFGPDGVIEFLGRMDHQIKIRGFRIELGEIEETLRTHPLIADCVVVARIDVARADGANTRLVAYIAGSATEIPDPRDFLKATLPGYMVPSAFVFLDSLPLLPNGKINRKALPPPIEKPDASRPRELPATPREKLLAAIWQEVLQVALVGIHDNFFELGGDSILSIQVVARANQAGLRITARQFFQHQTIAELAAAPEVQIARPSGIDELGEVPLTPVQHWFFEQKLEEPSRFNQSVLLEVPADTDAGLLAQAIEAMYVHHGALRLRFSTAANNWTQQAAPPASDNIFAVIDIADTSAMLPGAQAAEESIDIVHGPLIACRLFRFQSGEPSRLFLAAHHLAIDGVSWRILLEDLHNAYHRLPLPAKTTSFREWSLHLRQLAQTPALAAEAPFWLNRNPAPIPIDKIDRSGVNRVEDTASVSFELDEAETSALLRQAPQAYNARINEILLTALALGFTRTTGEPGILLELEGHGRHESDSGIDVSRTVGWFTSIFPVCLTIDPELPAGEALKSVRQQLRLIPSDGFGYPLLRYLSEDETLRNRLAGLPKPEILFNYHGQIDTALPRTSAWSLASENLAAPRSATALRTHLFEIVAAISKGKFRVDWLYSERIHLRATVERFANGFREQLRALVRTGIFIGDPTSIEDTYELSPLQQGILFHALYERNPAAYFQQFSFAIEGVLNVSALRQAWTNALQRHAILRTTFFWRDLDRPVQAVLRAVELPWESHDWHTFEEFLARDRRRGFDLQVAPLFRCTLFQKDETHARFCWSTHHILLDGWSASILFKEIFEDYVSLARGEARASAPAPRPFRDYIDWLARQNHAEAESWWRAELRGFHEPTPLLRNPALNSAPQQEQSLLLDEKFTADLQAQLRAHRVTLNAALRGAWAVLLSRYSNTADVVFGVTVSGRPPAFEGVEDMVGLFINTLPARVRVDHDKRFSDLLGEIQAARSAMDSYAFSSLADIQKWSELPAGSSLFESLLVFENYPVAAPPGLDPGEIRILDIRSFDETNYPLTVTVVPGARLQIRIAHNSQRFDRDTVKRMLGHLSTLLENFLADPGCLCGDLTILPEQERRQLVFGFNDTASPFDPAQTVVHRLEASPSSREFNARANRLARRLLQFADPGADDLVALIAHRSDRMADAILAIWKCGAAYVPIDPAYPAARIRSILEQSRPKLIITEAGVADNIPDLDLASFAPTVFLDDLDDSGDASDLDRAVPPHGLAYVIFTSGSTGTPKGVMIEHAGMLNHLLAKVRELRIGPDSVVAQNASHCFDISVWQFFAAPLAGGKTVVLGDDLVIDPARFLAAVASCGVTILEVVPSYLAVLLENPDVEKSALAKLKVLLVTGETASPALLRRWFRVFPGVPVVNAYGPTEASDDITHYRLSGPPETASIPVGRPIPNLRIYIVDERLRLCPIGVPGEICVSGVGVGRGYLNDEVRTRAVFLDDPFRPEPGSRMYRTGDIGWFLPDGTILLSGRHDQQVKIRGHRIELGEVENALEHLPEIARAVVAAHGESLIAYVIPAPGQTLLPDAIRRALAHRIPGYMTPQAFVTVANFPLTSNGKIDRGALARLTGPASPSTKTHIAPRTAEETSLLAVWEEVLGQTGIGVTDDYFDLGGHSILAVRLMARIEQTFHRRLPIAQLFGNPTIEMLAATLRDDASRPSSTGLVEIRAGGTATPLFLLPGAGGNVVYFHGLARKLAGNRPVYGLEAPGLDGSAPPLTSVEEIAARNIELVWPIAGTGRYALAGHSFGSSVALEMSRQLIAKGASIESLTIFDSTAPVSVQDAWWRAWDDTEWLLAIAHEIGVFLHADLRLTREDLEPLAPEARLTCILEKIASQGDWFAGAGPDRLRAYLQVYQANFRTVYEPAADALPVPIALFRSTESSPEDYGPSPEVAAIRQDRAWGWDRFSSHPVTVIDVPGDHLTMLLEPHVSVLARHLDALLESTG